MMNTEFTGAKIAVYIGGRLAVLQRDDIPGLAYAGCWDFPGGGREGGEGPLECALRECREELGLDLPPGAVVWEHKFFEDGRDRWFFVAELPDHWADRVVFGDEGQGWTLMTEEEFLGRTDAVGFLQERLRWWIKRRSGRKDPPPA